VLGADPARALAAAVLDAEAAASGPWAGAVAELCHQVAHDRAEARAAEWAELAPTIVSFEELNS
jgi:alpha-D-ribose 1-methylphosphonate 5-triphosphate synthase subunit PhnG